VYIFRDRKYSCFETEIKKCFIEFCNDDPVPEKKKEKC